MPPAKRRSKTGSSRAPKRANTTSAAISTAGVAGAAAASPASFTNQLLCDVRRRLTGLDPPHTLRGYTDERSVLTAMLTASIVRGESNSALVIGGRGSGKSTIVTAALTEAAKADGAAERGHRVVRLNGLAHADDGTALRELARQVQVELPSGDDGGPAESDPAGGAASEGGPARVSTGELVQALLAALKAGSKEKSQCLVVILDEFDLFAHNGKQSLLYTLLDTAQAGLTPLAVVGLTCRYDAEDLLEKRVLSRFSRRKFYLSKPLDFDEYSLAFREALSPSPQVAASFPDESKEWDAKVEAFSTSAAVIRELRLLYDTNGRDFRALLQLAMTAVMHVSASDAAPSAAALYAAAVKQRADSKTNIILSLSILEVCLIIALNNLSVDRPDEPINFEIAYKGYSDMLVEARASSVEQYGKPYSKAVSYKAFEHLADLELVKFSPGSSGTPPTFRVVHLMIEPEQITDALKRYPSLPTHMRSWLRQR